jgi:hypothetical protein
MWTILQQYKEAEWLPMWAEFLYYITRAGLWTNCNNNIGRVVMVRNYDVHVCRTAYKYSVQYWI